jgi:protein-tyrosine kinase
MNRNYDLLTDAADAKAYLPGADPLLASVAVASLTNAESPTESISACDHRWVPDRSQLLFLEPEPEYLIAREQFHTLRSRLHRIRNTQPLKTVLVTSAMPSEGKTFVSSNLALVLARQLGVKVLLIDGDLRHPRLHDVFGAPLSPGLGEYLSRHVDEKEAIQKAPMQNLHLVAGGNVVSNPAELIGNGWFAKLIARAAPMFDWIVVDSPPAVPIADASLMAEACDGVILVLRSGSTSYHLARQACGEFRGKPILGSVLNRVNAGATHDAYYYSLYGNGKR